MSSILSFTGAGTGAEYSPCGRYKYAEYVRWDSSLPSVMFILLNPSNDYQEQLKIRRCVDHAKFWGCGEVYITYLFAFRTPYIQQLGRAHRFGIDIIGPENDLESIGKCVDMVVFAW